MFTPKKTRRTYTCVYICIYAYVYIYLSLSLRRPPPGAQGCEGVCGLLSSVMCCHLLMDLLSLQSCFLPPVYCLLGGPAAPPNSQRGEVNLKSWLLRATPGCDATARPERPERPPRLPEESLRRPRRPKMAPRCPTMAHGGPKTAQDAPKTAQEASKKPPDKAPRSKHQRFSRRV